MNCSTISDVVELLFTDFSVMYAVWLLGVS